MFQRSIRWRVMWEGIKRYRKFPLINSWTTILSSISWQLPTFMLALYFSKSVVGFYALGYKVLNMPMSLIGQAVSQPFFTRASEAHKNGTITPLVEKTYNSLVVISSFPIFVLMIIGAIFSPRYLEQIRPRLASIPKYWRRGSFFGSSLHRFRVYIMFLKCKNIHFILTL